MRINIKQKIPNRMREKLLWNWCVIYQYFVYSKVKYEDDISFASGIIDDNYKLINNYYKTRSNSDA